MIEKIKQIVREAAGFMLSDSFDVTQKDGYANIVTSADIAVQKYLKKHLLELVPCSGFMGEEEEERDLSHEYTWIVDPIDGTANFSRGVNECSICVGLRHGCEMVAGVVFLPRIDEMYWAQKGQGAFMNGHRLQVSDRPFENAILCSAYAVYYKKHAKVCSDIMLDIFMQSNDFRRFGAAASEICYMAAGKCELYFEYRLSPWDFAAAMLILEEAGGIITDLQGNRLSGTSHSGVLAANNRKNFDKLFSIVRKHLEAYEK